MSIQAGINALIGQASGVAQHAKAAADIAAKAAAKPAAKPAGKTPEQAMASMRTKGQAQIKQRRRFTDYMANVQTNFGKFKELPPNLQKTVLKSYTVAERQKIMNQMDREAKRK